MTSVYVMDDSDGLVKIGISRHPPNRARYFRAAGKRVIVAYAGECADQRTAKAVETRTHASLCGFRQMGEWFAVNAERAVAAVKRAATDLGVEFSEATRDDGRLINMYATDDFIAQIDVWRKAQPGFLSRSEAIRLLVDQALTRKPGRG